MRTQVIPITALLAALSCSRAGGRQDGVAPPAPQARIGINLAGPVDWSTELPFVDVFKLSRAWISQREGESWGKGPPLEIDPKGWVRRLEPGCYAETPLCTIEGGHYPSGEYLVLYEGQGKLEFWGAAEVADERPGRMILSVDSARGGFFLRLRETDPDDYVRNIHVIAPGHFDTWREEPWSPAFLERWRGMAGLRFMDFAHTNGSPLATWAERPTLDRASFTGPGGVPLELQCDLANRLRADAWFCVPHRADDDFVRRMAELVKRHLDPARRVYLEYSNEVWNGQFAQHQYAAEQGRARGFAERSWEAAWRYTVHRSLEIFASFEEVFEGSPALPGTGRLPPRSVGRLVRVLPTQAANPYVSEQICAFQDAGQRANALGIAPYFGWGVPAEQAEAVAATGVGGVLDRVEAEKLPQSIAWMEQQKAIADRYGLLLIAYEAGQHLVGIGAGTDSEALTAVFHAVNRHPRMAEIYTRYYDAWERVGGDLLCAFSSTGRYSKWGSWGLLEYADQDPAKAPKYRATREWMQRRAGSR